MHQPPSQNVMYGSEADRFDIGVARSSGEILVLSVRYVKMGLGSGKMQSVSVKTGQVKGCTDPRVRM